MLAQLACKYYVPCHKIRPLHCKQQSQVFGAGPWSWNCYCLYSARSLTYCVMQRRNNFSFQNFIFPFGIIATASPVLHNMLRVLGLNIMEIKSLITEVKCLSWRAVCGTDQNGCPCHLCTIPTPFFAPSTHCQWSRLWKTNCWEKPSRTRASDMFCPSQFFQQKTMCRRKN